MRTVLLLSLTLFTTACLAGGGSTCDNGGLDKVVSALEEAPPEMRTTLSAVGVSEACRGPDFSGAVSASPDQRAMVLAKFVQEHPAEWNKGCPAGTGVFASIATAAPEGRTGLLYSKCKLENHGWTLAEAERMGDDLLLAVIVAGRLKGVDTTRKQRILKLMVP